VLRLLSVVALAAVLASGPAGATNGLVTDRHEAVPASALRLDGLRFEPELALTPAKRTRGLMFRRKAPADGMLFVFPTATTGGFWMKNTLVPLTIVFFDSRGKRVAKLTMTPCRTASCRIYDPGRQYRFALELGAADRRTAARIGPLAELGRLTRAAT
jgi:uncharacterized membrane protein (UPF0127 family)